jgi:4-amino-4-deoxy-L-arabinose transferase-like glycosyltransferase
MSALRSPLFITILLAYLVMGGLYASLTPNWQAPDEPAHYNYVRYLAANWSFPELVSGCYDQAYLEQLTSRRFPPELSIDRVCYEYHQPPFFYVLTAPVFNVSNGSLLALRLVSVILGAGVVSLAFLVGQTIFPSRPAIAYGTMAFVAFGPMHLAILASVNNDALAELMIAAILLLLIRRLLASRPTSTRQEVSLGLLLGLGLIAKTTVYIAVPLVVVTLWWTTPDWRRFAKQAALIFGLALVLALPWYLRNSTLYGGLDVLGLGRHDEIVVGQLRTVDFLTDVGWTAYASSFVSTTFRSFWGQFGWMAVPMDGRTYLLLTLLTLIAVAGLIGFWSSVFSARPKPRYELSTGSRRALGLLALAILLMVLGYVWYNLTFVQFQGRYLFPALIPLGLYFTLGLEEAFSPRRAWWLAGGLALASGWIVVSGVLGGNLDKWALLLVGLAFLLALGRAWLARRWPVPASWLMAICYGGLALLALLSPFWFVVPYLSP